MDIMQAITTVGFPIVACVVMAGYLKYITDMHEKARKEESLLHREEMQKITDALNNNTLALTVLTENLKNETEEI